jgi:hypothetical protein
MSRSTEDLSTADLAAQQPTDTTPRQRTDEPIHDRARDVPFDDHPGHAGMLDDNPGHAGLLDGGVAEADTTLPATGQHQQQVQERSIGAPTAAAVYPSDADAVDPARASSAPSAGRPGGPLLATEDGEGFRARWTDVQTTFVDAPRESVEQADALVAELMQHLARTFADERGRLEHHWDRGSDVPTDDLRTAFQRYRSFFERLLTT